MALIRQAGHHPDMDLWTRPLDVVVSVAAACFHTPKPGGCGPIDPGNCVSHGNCGGGQSA